MFKAQRSRLHWVLSAAVVVSVGCSNASSDAVVQMERQLEEAQHRLAQAEEAKALAEAAEQRALMHAEAEKRANMELQKARKALEVAHAKIDDLQKRVEEESSP